MTMCGYQMSETSDESLENIIISGGTNGNIMIWRIPSKKDIESSKTDSENSYQIACWDRAHE